MKQEDYDAIAGIIKENMIKLSINKDAIRVEVINDLANYFEKESPKDEYEYCPNDECGSIVGFREKFDKEQFLKDCGVK